MQSPFSDHSLSQRGMGWCHVPSAWQTAVKDSSFRLPCMGEKNISVGSSESHIPFPTFKYYSVCPSSRCCPVAALLQFQSLSSPSAAFSLPCVRHRLQILRSRPRYEQPATIKTRTSLGCSQSRQEDGKGDSSHVLLPSFQGDTLVYQCFLGSLSLLFCGDFVNQ